jgi:hypothetical protein
VVILFYFPVDWPNARRRFPWRTSIQQFADEYGVLL